MQAVLKVPDNAISHTETQTRENGIKHRIERDNCTVVNIISDLPTNAAIWRKAPYTLSDNRRLLIEVAFQLKSFLIFLSDIIRRRCNNKF